MLNFNYESLKDRIYACWIGKNIGGTMGTPYEGGREVLDIQGFVTKPGEVLPNDDLDLQLVWLRACEEYQPLNVDAKVLSEFWINFITPNWNEYGIGKSNMRIGMLPPLCGDYLNDWKHSNGAWIRTEVWACMAPGCPDVAIKYAAEDACVDHGMGEGTYAAIFVAAVEAAAFIVKDIRELIRIGLSKIPEDCRVARSVKLVCDCYDNGIDWKTARAKVVEDSADLGWFEAPANVAYVILGLLYGEGDFKRSMILAINCGDDTDCTGATIGSIMGIMGGMAFIPADWREHLGDDIVTISVNWGSLYGKINTCTELTDRVMFQIPDMLRANRVYDVNIHAEEDSAPADYAENVKGGEIAKDLCARPSRSYDLDFIHHKVRVIYDADPSVEPNGEIPMRIEFNKKSGRNTVGPSHISLRWILPEGWTVSGAKKELYISHNRPSIATLPDLQSTLSFTIHAGEDVAFCNRIILEAIYEGHPMPMLIPITIYG